MYQYLAVVRLHSAANHGAQQIVLVSNPEDGPPKLGEGVSMVRIESNIDLFPQPSLNLHTVQSFYE